MKALLPSTFALAFAAAVLLAGVPGRAETASDAQVAARSEVLDLAGAFQNDGFKIRDGAFFGEAARGRASLLSVNLYSGNAYWFSAACGKNVDGLRVSVYDEQGRPVKAEDYTGGNRAAAGFSPEVSGLYYVKVSNEGSQTATFCLIYSYK